MMLILMLLLHLVLLKMLVLLLVLVLLLQLQLLRVTRSANSIDAAASGMPRWAVVFVHEEQGRDISVCNVLFLAAS